MTIPDSSLVPKLRLETHAIEAPLRDGKQSFPTERYQAGAW